MILALAIMWTGLTWQGIGFIRRGALRFTL
ncbi:Hypotetical protein [Gulosibacter molinativorax]|nr:Hypotetical protein [Gulosibacter molinativorax]